MFILRPFLVALQFLTVFPVHLKEIPNDQTIGRSLLYYPVVGLLIGLLLATIAWAGNGLLTSLWTAIVLTIWIVLTGALHLDGLADSADAWIGGLGDRQKTLSIMKDPYCGPAAVVTLVLLLLIKFVALEHIITTENWADLALVPMLGRAALVLLFLTTPYVRENGLGNLLKKHLPRRASTVIVFSSFIAIPVILGMNALWLLFATAGSFLVLRNLMRRRIGGTTGDTAGALVEITETAILLAAVVMG